MLIRYKSRILSAACLSVLLAFLLFFFKNPANVRRKLDHGYAYLHDATHGKLSLKYVKAVSKITADGAYFPIEFGERASLNPNIIPHPQKEDTWVIVAQRDKSQDDDIVWFTELVCEATFSDDGILRCTEAASVLPIASTVSSQCDDDLSFFNLTIGPHDARVFHGPDQPYVMYGSQSHYNCFGQWMHDFRRVFDWSAIPDPNSNFFWPTDLQRPGKWLRVEKNWFAFWDAEGEMYIHHSISPNRVFSKLEPDGSVSEDLAPLATSDQKCMKKLMPRIKSDLEYIHQATNSLSITLCKRSDPDCTQNGENTFLFTIFQFKTFYKYHGVYEPYIMLFKQSAPFEVHGVSKPIWISGRGEPGGSWTDGTKLPKGHTQMLYVTSMSWKQQGMAYHGYLDDELFVGFGVEDKSSAGIDVVVGDLLENVALCLDAESGKG